MSINTIALIVIDIYLIFECSLHRPAACPPQGTVQLPARHRVARPLSVSRPCLCYDDLRVTVCKQSGKDAADTDVARAGFQMHRSAMRQIQRPILLCNNCTKTRRVV